MSKNFPLCNDCDKKVLCSMTKDKGVFKVKHLRVDASKSLFIIADEGICEGILKHPNVATATNWHRQTPLHFVAKYSMKSLDMPESYRAKDCNGDTPLHWAANSPLVETDTEKLLAHEYISVVKNYRGDTPLHTLTSSIKNEYYSSDKQKEKNKESIGKILKHPDTHVVKNRQGNTPLHELANIGWGSTSNIEFLDHKYTNSAECINEMQQTPLWVFASQLSYTENLLELLDIILARPDLTTYKSEYKNGATVLHELTRQVSSDKEAIKKLLKHPEIKTCKNDSGNTPYKMLKGRARNNNLIKEVFEELKIEKEVAKNDINICP